MGEIVKCIAKGLPWYQYVILAVCAGLMIAGFFMPPKGEIDPSVLKGVGELLLGTWLFAFSTNLPDYIKAGASVAVRSNGTEIEVSSKK